MALSSGIYKTYPNKFIADEDGLRRIEGALLKAAAVYEHKLSLIYHVEREDHRFFETTDLNEILSDPNIAKKRIIILGIELQITDSETGHNTGDPVAHIIFDKEHEPDFDHRDVMLRIACPNKTWALLLADELEPQITRLFKAKRTSRWILYIYMVLIGTIAFRIAQNFERDTRLAILIGIGTFGFAFLLRGFIKIASFFDGAPKWTVKCFGPESVFLWGDELHDHPERERFRRNVFWSILVAFLVALAASLAVLIF